MKKTIMFSLDIPDKKSGEWEIDTIEVEQETRRGIIDGYSNRSVPPGTYKRLKRGITTVMSNTPDEINDCLHFIFMAKDHVLINGLGMGMTVKMILENPKVTQLTIIEKSKNVINLVGDHYNDPRLTIIHTDAFVFEPPKNVLYGAIWHDIWDNIEIENWEEMELLIEKYDGITNWQGCWCEDEVFEMVKEERADNFMKNMLGGNVFDNIDFEEKQEEIDQLKLQVDKSLNGKELKI